MAEKFCYYIPVDGYVEGYGYRASVVYDGVAGHSPTGDWPYSGEPGQRLPWFWGMTHGEAEIVCKEENARLGVTEKEADLIVTSSMAAQNRQG